MKIQYKCLLIIALILAADQTLKIWVKTHLCLGQEIPLLGNKAYLYFIENEGMAFGIKLGGSVGKFLLTLFRIIFTGVLGWCLVVLIRRKIKPAVIFAISVNLAAAAGNLIDCLFYGLIFNASTQSSVAQLLPPLGGYAPFMFGSVVDMLYFPVIDVALPEWLPAWGGERFVFFRPVFNIADAALTSTILYLLIFQRKTMSLLLGSQKRPAPQN